MHSRQSYLSAKLSSETVRLVAVLVAKLLLSTFFDCSDAPAQTGGALTSGYLTLQTPVV